MKFIALIACLILLAACGNDRAQEVADEAQADQTTPSEADTAEANTVVSLNEPVSEPDAYGPYDAAWRVAVDIDALRGLSAGEQLEGFMTLPELGRVNLRIRDTEGDPRRVLRGDATLDEGAGGSFTISLRNNRLEGQFRLERRRYVLQTESDGSHRLLRVDESRLPDPHPPGGPLTPEEPDEEEGPA
ncbi:hypothetical protein J2T60_002568 [Natronospira proteinivora]|uniref:Lipoprotein n=1 Tax=Natronospira proteinivora TaxID=1807133 RepID=A0ABT1GB55_9GAMM|nr:hypothetical protein [Natronospira proteinivora]MCP1728554.1 hypothetical protein [Natronospira proteinivora]